LQHCLRGLDAIIDDIAQKQNAGTITYQIPSSQITWIDPVSNNAITVQLAIQDLYGHIHTIYGSPSFNTGVIPENRIEFPGLPPNQNIPQGLYYYLTNIHSRIYNLSSLELKHLANSTSENLSICI
jgi:hypothetical protein